MSYNLEGGVEASGDGPDIAVMEGTAGDLAVDGPQDGLGETVTYPAVSVIIPTYTKQRWEWLQECVASVRAQQVPPLEIIVVVDHNPELLEEIAAEFPDVIAVPNIGDQGVSGARNSGVKASRGEVAAFLDDDSIATPDWLSTLLPKEPTAVRNVWTSAMLVWRSAFEVVDGFREDFGKIGNRSLPEDTDLCLRIASARENSVWIWDPAKVMKHRVPAGRATFGYLMSRCFLQGWGKAAMARMDGFAESTSAERKYAVRTLPLGVGRGLADAVRGDVSGLGRSGAIVAALTVTLGGYAWYMLEGLAGRRRRREPSATA